MLKEIEKDKHIIRTGIFKHCMSGYTGIIFITKKITKACQIYINEREIKAFIL